ncbi:MAG: gliding motility-associated C-terminal domain-containing protein [Flavobacteriales bacterium]
MRTLFFTWIIFFVGIVNAQIPTQCLEIESILVDACVPGAGCTSAASSNCSCEGKNEMVRFIVGPSPIPIGNLTVTWPNNSFLGIATPNATTASLVATLQSTVQSPCGRLLEPPGGIIPAGKRVLLITSTDMCTGANSFAGLQDTLYVIFQNPGNFQGHFANHNNSGTATTTPTGASNLRTLTIGVSSPVCSDIVTYDRALLVNQSGTYGGAAALNDGSRVDFDFLGTPTYVNEGCTAPFVSTTLDISLTHIDACIGDTLTINAIVDGFSQGIQWTGGNGVFLNASALSASYIVSVSDAVNFYLYVQVSGTCSLPIKDSVLIQLTPLPQPEILVNGSLSFCSGATVNLSAGGVSSFSWSTGAVASSISVSVSGMVYLSSTNVCGTVSDSVEVEVFSNPLVSFSLSPTICINDSPLSLFASPSGGVFSGNGLSGTMFDPSAAGSGTHFITYQFTDGNGCSSSSVQSITVIDAGAAQINNPGAICENASVLNLSATPSGGVWVGSAITNPSTGLYDPALAAFGSDTVIYFVSISGCSAYDTLILSLLEFPTVQITTSDTIILCSGQSATLQATGTGVLTWSNGVIGSTNVVSNSGFYSVNASNACGTVTNGPVLVLVETVIASISPGSLSGDVPLAGNFIATNSPGASFTWISNTGGSGSGAVYSETFSDSGTFNVVLIATSPNGCIATDTVWVYAQELIEDSLYLFIPNVFSPNDDGQNDRFKILSYNYSVLEIEIFNRWGVSLLLYDAKQTDWDGEFLGREAAEGVYYYIVKAVSVSGKTQVYSGTITLIRN